MNVPATLWVLERVGGGRFPYLLTIRRGDEELLALRTQDRWPGGNGNAFCLRQRDPSARPEPAEELERVPVVSLHRFGKRLSVVLDRPTRKRCELLFLTKHYLNGDGEYEQIFWQTQKGLRERRPRARFVAGRGLHGLHVAVASDERYPWTFPGCHSERLGLAVGDYALLERGDPVAVVERKTFANLLRDLSDLRILHHQLAQLAAHPSPALVVEADYADFLKPDRIQPLNVPYTTRALAEISALHPSLQVVYAGNRKLAMEWTRAFFAAVDAQGSDRMPAAVQETLALYGVPDATDQGSRLRVVRAVREELPEEFSIADLRRAFPDLAVTVLRAALAHLRDRGEIARQGRGRASCWVKRHPGSPPDRHS